MDFSGKINTAACAADHRKTNSYAEPSPECEFAHPGGSPIGNRLSTARKVPRQQASPALLGLISFCDTRPIKPLLGRSKTLQPVSVEPMGVECFAVSAGHNLGFYSLDVANIRGSYDAEKGLLLVVPVSVFDPNKGVGKSAGDVKVRVNRKNGNSVAIEE